MRNNVNESGSKIGIVGASIAGSACAIQLKQIGFDVTLFEKSRNSFQDRGAGIMLPQSLLQRLVSENLLLSDFPSIPISKRMIFTCNMEEDKPRLLTIDTILGAVAHWGSLYQELRSHLDQSACHYGVEVTDVQKEAQAVSLTLDHSEQVSFDYVIFADGVHSLGRNMLFPDLTPRFAQYVAWRGLVRIDKNQIKKMLGSDYNQELHWFLYEKGHALLYAIPDIVADEKTYLINWVIYEQIDGGHSLFKRRGCDPQKNISPGAMPSLYMEYLHGLVDQYFSAFPRELFKMTEHPFTQAIYDLELPHYVVDHCCLIGDASTLLRPHTASGAAKALQDALVLGQACRENPANLDVAFAEWDKTQCALSHQLIGLGRAIGKQFVTDLPHLKSLDKQKIESIWRDATAKFNWYVLKK